MRPSPKPSQKFRVPSGGITPLYPPELSRYDPYPLMSVYVEFDPTDRTLTVVAEPPGERPAPFPVIAGQKLRWPVRNDWSGDTLLRLLNDPQLHDLLGQVADEYDLIADDAGDLYGVPSVNAEQFLLDVADLIKDEWGDASMDVPGDFSVWTASEWFIDPPKSLTRNPGMTDDDFEFVVGVELGVAKAAKVHVAGLRDYLESLRIKEGAQ